MRQWGGQEIQKKSKPGGNEPLAIEEEGGGKKERGEVQEQISLQEAKKPKENRTQKRRQLKMVGCLNSSMKSADLRKIRISAGELRRAFGSS